MSSMAAGGGEGEDELVTPGELLGDSSGLIAGTGAYVAPNGRSIRASLAGIRRITPPQSDAADQVASPLFSFFTLLSSLVVRDLGFGSITGVLTVLGSFASQRSTVEVVGHKAQGAVPQPGSVVIARVSLLPFPFSCVFVIVSS